MKPYTIAIAGSTEHTVQCAEVLRSSEQFQISWILTPTPKLVGRDQVLTQNPLHQWAVTHQLPVILIEKKIDADMKNQIEQFPRPDFLLVVDFGYLVPNWLLAFPHLAPLNIHPSLLPQWRGSSPGQFSLLFGEKNSGVTLMQMDAGLDTGPVIHQAKFAVEATWTQLEYYQHAFNVISEVLVDQIVQFAKTGHKHDQPSLLPVIMARRFTKEDGFVSWKLVKSLLAADHDSKTIPFEKTLTNQNEIAMTTLLSDVVESTKQSWPLVLEQASRALFPWPTLWTIVPTVKGNKRMQILQAHVEINNGKENFFLDQVKIEGQAEANWSQVKNQVL